jgi:uncharacterized membrane protein
LRSVALPPLPADLEYCVVARVNDSLEGVRWQVFGVLAAVSLVVAGGFALAGAWPVLAWSVLEVGVLAAAFLYCERRAREWERLTVAGDLVVVEQAAGERRQRLAFNRYWLRVEVEANAAGRSPRLTLCSGGTRQEFGRALPPAERLAVAKELRQLTGLR